MYLIEGLHLSFVQKVIGYILWIQNDLEKKACGLMNSSNTVIMYCLVVVKRLSYRGGGNNSELIRQSCKFQCLDSYNYLRSTISMHSMLFLGGLGHAPQENLKK